MSPRPFFSLSIKYFLLPLLLAGNGASWAAEKPKNPPKATVTGGTLTLEQAYDRTLATDQTIKIAYWEIRKANLLPWSALAKLGPQLSAGGSYQKSNVHTLTTVR